MKTLLPLLVILLFSCKSGDKKQVNLENDISTVITEDYELVTSSLDKALLVLFPGGGTTSVDTKREFDIVDKAADRGISVLLMNFNRRLWIVEDDCQYLEELISTVRSEHNINSSKIYLGGMSLGGTVALTLSDFLIGADSALQPKGAFVIDSPIDLYALYESSQKDVLRADFSEERLAEPRGIIGYLESEFGGKDSLLTNIQEVSPITLQTGNYDGIVNLKDTKIRLYTEPDTLWWKDVRQTDFDGTNAYVLQHTANLLKENNFQKIDLIQTKDKGYRSNGERHPHSWSIVDVDELIDWVLE